MRINSRTWVVITGQNRPQLGQLKQCPAGVGSTMKCMHFIDVGIEYGRHAVIAIE